MPANASHSPLSARLRRRVFEAPSGAESRFITRALRHETVGGGILLVMTIVAVSWANSPWSSSYDAVRNAAFGPLTLEHWAADGGLALFFLVAGLELKRELSVGSLSKPADAMVPVAAALGGMAAPALIYLSISFAADGDTGGWAVPTATDIAFALAVLAVVGRSLPPALRAFLLTLAVVDDLGAIAIIATVFTDTIDLLPLGAAIGLLAVYLRLQRARVRAWWLYVPLAAGVWWLVYSSGVHATIAGVALGLLTRARHDPDEGESPAERVEHRLRPLSAGFAVPAFALMSAGVHVTGDPDLLTEPIVVGIVLGLFVGKTVGVLGGAWLVARLTRAELSPDLSWRDIGAVAVLSGVGFTVSLLIADLAFSAEEAEEAKTAVLVGSLLATLAAALLLRRRNRAHQSQQMGEPSSV